MQAGTHDLPREFIDGHKRKRVVPAAAAVAHRHGILETTTTRILKAAQMSRNTYYDLFEGRSDCLRFCFGEACERMIGPIEVAGGQPGPWLDRVRAALDALFATVVEEPLLAELCLVQAASAPAEADGSGSEAVVSALARAIEGGREVGRGALGSSYFDPAPQTEELLARAVVTVTATRIRHNEIEVLPGHRDELTQLIAFPFLGAVGTATGGAGQLQAA